MKFTVPEGTAADAPKKYVATPQASCLDADLLEGHQGTTLQDMANGLFSARSPVTDESLAMEDNQVHRGINAARHG